MGCEFLMNTIKTLIFFILTFLSLESFAVNTRFEDNFNIKAGLNLNRVYLNTTLIPNENKNEDHSESTAVGFSTSVGYKWTNWEFMFGSDVFFGNLKDLSFKINSNEVIGTGHYRVFSLSPILRYYTPYSISNRWNVFVSAGPSLSLHTFVISSTSNGSTFSNKKRISYENRGGTINIGVEEIVPYKETHPTFFEIGYSYMRSRQLSIVDASDFKDVKTLEQGISNDFYAHYLILRFGITLF